MSRRLKILAILLFSAVAFVLPAQHDAESDSLRQALRTYPHDTAKALTLNLLAWKYRVVDPDTAITIAKEALRLSEQHGFKRGIAKSNQNLGQYYQNTSRYDEALVHYLKALDMWKRIDTLPPFGRISTSLGAIGTVYSDKGDYNNSLRYLLQGMKIDEENKNTKALVVKLTNIGNVYHGSNDFEKALGYFSKALDLVLKNDIKEYKAVLCNNIGGVYVDLSNAAGKHFSLHEKDSMLKKSIGFYTQAIGISEASGRKNLLATSYGNLGAVYFDLAKLDSNNTVKKRRLEEEAMQYYTKALRIDEEMNNALGASKQLANMGALNTTWKKYSEAEKQLLKAIKIGEETGALDNLEQYEVLASALYDRMNKFDKALFHYKKYIAFRDSIFNDENTRQMVKLEMNYAFEKKETASRLDQEKREAISAAETNKQRLIIYSVCAVLILTLLFAIFAYRSFLQKKKSNAEITMQKHMIEEKQKEILDSIHYAKRIQTALLPTETYIRRHLEKLTAQK